MAEKNFADKGLENLLMDHVDQGLEKLTIGQLDKVQENLSVRQVDKRLEQLYEHKEVSVPVLWIQIH